MLIWLTAYCLPLTVVLFMKCFFRSFDVGIGDCNVIRLVKDDDTQYVIMVDCGSFKPAVKKYVDEYDRTIAQRLRNDVNELRNELNQMKDVLHKIQVCPYLAECPVLDELLEQQKGSKPDADQPEA